MGRARNGAAGVGVDNFGAVVGTRRGAASLTDLGAAQPAPAAMERLARARADVSSGDYDEALRILAENRMVLRSRPHLNELLTLVARQAANEAEKANTQAMRRALDVSATRRRFATRLLQACEDDRQLHYWPAGDSYAGPDDPRLRGTDRRTACGLDVIESVCITIPRGEWRSTPAPSRCEACARAAAGDPETRETRGRYDILNPDDWSTARAGVRARLRDAIASGKTSTPAHVADEAIVAWFERVANRAAEAFEAAPETTMRRIHGEGLKYIQKESGAKRPWDYLDGLAYAELIVNAMHNDSPKCSENFLADVVAVVLDSRDLD